MVREGCRSTSSHGIKCDRQRSILISWPEPSRGTIISEKQELEPKGSEMGKAVSDRVQNDQRYNGVDLKRAKYNTMITTNT